MAVNIDIVSEKLFNILKGFGYEVKSFDKDGDLVLNPQEATRFAVADPNLLARINLPEKTIMLATSEDLSEEPVRDMVKHLAQDYLMNFDYKIFDKKIKPKGDWPRWHSPDPNWQEIFATSRVFSKWAGSVQ